MAGQSSVAAAPIVITGTSRNIGAYLAARFLDAGQPVIAQYRSETGTITELVARGAIPVQGDFASPEATLQIAETLSAAAPRLRAVIHNASAFAPTSEDVSKAAQQFQTFFEVHMRAPHLLNTRLAGHLRGPGKRPGDIVHITDIYADNPAVPYDIYCATKAGLQSLSLAFAKRLGPDVKVNAIQPGAISFENWVDADQRRAMLEATPLGRTGSAEAIYQAIRAVLDNDYQTGAVIPVDGGRRLGR